MSSNVSSVQDKENDGPTTASTLERSASLQTDCARGWIAISAAAVTTFVYIGTIYSWGIIEAGLVESTSISLLALTFVGSLATSFQVFTSWVARLAVQKFGFQKTALMGALLMGLGEFVASWLTQHLAGMFIMHGVVFGIGGGLSIFPCLLAPLQWFEKYRGLAVGIVFGGGSLGAAVISTASHFLVEAVGVPWTFRFIGLLLWAVCVPCALFIREGPATAKSMPGIQWYRYRQKKFLFLVVGTGLSCFALFIPAYFIPIFVKSLSSSADMPVVVLTIWNLASTVGRVLSGAAADLIFGPVNSLIISTLLTGLSALVIWPFASTMSILVVFAVINGIGCGSFFSLVPTVVGAIFGKENSLGIVPVMWTSWSLGFFFGSPIAAGLYSLHKGSAGTESYRPAAYYTGSIALFGLLFILVTRFMQNKKCFCKV